MAEAYSGEVLSEPPSKSSGPEPYTGEVLLTPPKQSSGGIDSGDIKVAGKAFVRGLPGTGGFLGAAGATSAAINSPPGLATQAAIAGVTGPAAPVVLGAIQILGPIAGGMIGAYGVTSMTEKLNALIDPKGWEKWQQDKQAHPEAELAGSFASGFAGSSWKTAPKMSETAMQKFMTNPIVQRMTGAGMMGGLDAAQQYAQTGKVDPKMVAASAAGGYMLPGLNVAGKVAHGLGAAAVNAKFGPAKKPKIDTKPEDLPSDKDVQNPNTKKEALAKIEKYLKERNERAPLVETAIRNKETGEIERMGPKHDEARKEETKDTHDQGFMDERGKFLDRKEALKRAIDTKMIPDDHPLSVPEEGLHSGDLRSAGNDKFAVKESDKTGVNKEEPPPKTAPVTREEFKKALEESHARSAELDVLIAHETNEKNPGKVDALTKEQNAIKEQIKQLEKDLPPVEFKSFKAPTSEELIDHMYGIKTAGDAIDHYLTSGLGYPSHRVLLEILRKSPWVNSHSIEFTNKQLYGRDKEGNYFKATGLHLGTSVQVGKGGNSGTFVHELIHAATVELINRGHPAGQQLNELYEKYKQEYNKQSKDEVENRKRLGATEEELLKYLKDRKKYGFENNLEFVAEAFTSKKFMQVLKSMRIGDRVSPVSENNKGVIKSVYDQFVDIIREALNIPEEHYTALDEVMDAGLHAIRESASLGSSKDLPHSLSTSPSASKMADDIVNSTGEEGIPFTHDSFIKHEGKFDWKSHALRGEGAMAKGAGTYVSTSDQVHKWYRDSFTSKLRQQREANLTREQRDAIDIYENNVEYFDLVYHENLENYEKAKQLFGDTPETETMRIRMEESFKEAKKAEKDYFDALSKLDGKSPVYHGVLKVKPEELLDWDATKQSDLVNKAFEKLGIDTSRKDISDFDILSDKYKDKWKDEFTKDGGKTSIEVKGRTYSITKRMYDDPFGGHPHTEYGFNDGRKTEWTNKLEHAKRNLRQHILDDFNIPDKDMFPSSGEDLYKKLAKKIAEDVEKRTGDHLGPVEAQRRASILLAKEGVVGNVHNAAGGKNSLKRNYVMFDDSPERVKTLFTQTASKENGRAPEEENKIKTVDPGARKVLGEAIEGTAADAKKLREVKKTLESMGFKAKDIERVVDDIDPKDLRMLLNDEYGNFWKNHKSLPGSLQSSFKEWLSDYYSPVEREERMSHENIEDTYHQYVNDILDVEQTYPGSYSSKEITAALSYKHDISENVVSNILDKARGKPSASKDSKDIPNVRDIASDKDFYEKAADVLEAHGSDAAYKFYQDYQAYKKTWSEPIKEIEKFVGININNKLAKQRLINLTKKELLKDLPDEAVREKVAIAVDSGDLSSLNPKELEVANKFEQKMKDIGDRAMDAGVVKGLLENYVSHIIEWAGAPKGLKEEFVQAILGTNKQDPAMKGMSVESKFAKQRSFKTFADLQQHLDDANVRIKQAGIPFELKIKTKDVAEIYHEYATSMEKAIENKSLIENIQQIRNVAGESLIRDITPESPLPYGWEAGQAQLAGKAIHPDLMPALRFVFDAGSGDIMGALGAISQAVKRMNVVGSFFHAKSLLEVISSSGIPIWTPVKELGLGVVDKVLGTKLSGITKAIEQFRENKLGDTVDKWIKDGGLVLDTPEDVTKNVLALAGKAVDEMIAKFGPKTRILEKSLSTVEKYTLGLFDKFTWDYLMTGGKIMVAERYLDKARLDAAKSGKEFDELASRKEISRFVNDSFGGLNYFDIATQTQNEFAKRVAMSAYNPAGRRGLQIALFAPDWTVSTVRAFTAALPDKLNPAKWHPVEGAKGMLNPTTRSDYARLYQMKTALTYFTLLNMINMVIAGRPIWENKDPTRIEFKDGTSLQAMKHAMEPYHWIADPDKTLSNKLGFIPKAAIVGIAGTEYAGPYAKKLVDPSTKERLKVIAESALPFQMQAASHAPPGEGVKRALLGTAGLPVYGSTPEQKKLDRAEREKKQKQKMKEYREKAKEKGWQ